MTDFRQHPFDAFEVRLVGEFPDHSGGTYCEPIDGTQGEGWVDEAIGQFFTVYGHRSFPEDKAPPLDWCDDPSRGFEGEYRNGIPVTTRQAAEYDEWRRRASEPKEGLGATAISDFEEVEDARLLAYALADGKPVFDYTAGGNA